MVSVCRRVLCSVFVHGIAFSSVLSRFYEVKVCWDFCCCCFGLIPSNVWKLCFNYIYPFIWSEKFNIRTRLDMLEFGGFLRWNPWKTSNKCHSKRTCRFNISTMRCNERRSSLHKNRFFDKCSHADNWYANNKKSLELLPNEGEACARGNREKNAWILYKMALTKIMSMKNAVYHFPPK